MMMCLAYITSTVASVGKLFGKSLSEASVGLLAQHLKFSIIRGEAPLFLRPHNSQLADCRLQKFLVTSASLRSPIFGEQRCAMALDVVGVAIRDSM